MVIPRILLPAISAVCFIAVSLLASYIGAGGTLTHSAVDGYLYFAAILVEVIGVVLWFAYAIVRPRKFSKIVFVLIILLSAYLIGTKFFSCLAVRFQQEAVATMDLIKVGKEPFLFETNMAGIDIKSLLRSPQLKLELCASYNLKGRYDFCGFESSIGKFEIALFTHSQPVKLFAYPNLSMGPD